MGTTNLNNDKNNLSQTADANKQDIFPEELGPVPTIGKRHWLCFWLFWLIFLGFAAKVVLSIAIVAMMDPLASVNPDVPTYPHWTQKGTILSAFFWGYVCPQVFAGYAANRFGGKWFLVSTMGIHSFLEALGPVTAAYFGPIGFIITRVVQGICQGFFFPTATHMLSQWVPREERSRLGNINTLGAMLGTATALLSTGIIAASAYGWPLIFYLYGAAGLLWCLCFTILGHNTPSEHPSISKAEKYYIENSIGHNDEKPSQKPPWIAIFTSKPVWALILAHSGNVFGFWVILNQIPSYMKYVMNFDIISNSILSSLPYLTVSFLGLILSFLSDYVINKGFLSQTASRKVFNTIGSVVPALALIMLAYTKPDLPDIVVALLIVTVGFNAFTNLGFAINPLDLSPNHAGTLMGISNGIANMLAIFAPLMIQILVKNESDPDEWKSVFFIAAACYVATAISFIIFGSGKTQPWNNDQYEDKKRNNE